MTDRAQPATMTRDALLAVLDAAGWSLSEDERTDTYVLRGMVTCELNQR